MHMSDWSLLQTLYACRNLTRAAETLYVSQPTLSKRLKAIEEELHITIAVRGKQGLTFTPEGEYLAVKAAQINSIFQETRQQLSLMSQEISEPLSIGSSSSIARFFLPFYLQKLKVLHPHVQFHLVTRLSSQIISLVQHQKLQMGFVNGNLNFSGEKKKILTEQAYLASSSPISLEQLPSQPYLTYFKDPRSQRLLEDWWQEHFLSPFPPGLTVKDGTICKEMICRGLGYSIFFTREYMEDHPDYIQPLYHKDGTPLCRDTWLIWQKDSCQGTFAEELIHMIPEARPFS